MVYKLGLEVKKHPKYYKLQGLNDSGEMRVIGKVMIPITIGKYEDEIICDILPMDASHILLGRPWQYDRRVTHNGFTNQHSFEFKVRKIMLAPMTSQEIYEVELLLEQRKGANTVSDPQTHSTQKKNRV